MFPVADPVEEPPFYFGTRERPWIGCGLHLPTHRKVLRSLCDRYLNHPVKEAHFEAIENTMWCTVNLYQQAGSRPQPHEGWVEYLEITFMFAVRRTVEGRPDQLCWFLPALFLDGTGITGTRSVIYAIAGGREIFGLPKTAAEINFSQSGYFRLAGADLKIVDLPIGQERPAPLELQQLLAVSAVPAEEEPTKTPARSPERRWASHLLGLEPGDLRYDQKTGIGLIPSMADLQVTTTQVFGGPLVGLKQLHDATHYRSASFQEVVESSYQIEEWYEQEPYLYADHVLRFTDTENVRLVESLGLEVDRQGEIRVPAGDSYYLEASAVFGAPGETSIWHFG